MEHHIRKLAEEVKDYFLVNDLLLAYQVLRKINVSLSIFVCISLSR